MRAFPAIVLFAAFGIAEFSSAEPASNSVVPIASAIVKKRAAKVLPGMPVELKTQDGWNLAAQYLPAKENKPTFILLHETGRGKESWYYLAKAMARRGIGMIAVDLRGHGNSQNPPPGAEAHWRKFRAEKNLNDWISMVQDVDAAMAYLKDAGVPAQSIGLGGADVGSSIALRYAAIHKDIRGIFMLSPGLSYREVLTVNAMRLYGKRPILMIVGADDKRSMAETPILYQFAKNAAGPENAILLNVEREHGARMLLVNKGLITKVVEWMESPQQFIEMLLLSTDTGHATFSNISASTDTERQDGAQSDQIPLPTSESDGTSELLSSDDASGSSLSE